MTHVFVIENDIYLIEEKNDVARVFSFTKGYAMANPDIFSGHLGMATPFGDLLGRSDAEMMAEIVDYKDMGVKMVRLDIHWTLVRPDKNKPYDWSLVDKVFNALHEADIEILAILNNTPKWVNKSMSSPSDHQAYADFARDAVARYDGIVDYWELFNEPNLAGIKAENYAQMLIKGHDAIKSVSPGDIVISAGLSPVPFTTNGFYGAANYVETMYKSGAGGKFDALGFHPYTYPLMPVNTQPWNGWEIMRSDIREIMDKNGDGQTQIWITEFGAPTHTLTNKVSESKHSEMLLQANEFAQDNDWIGPILWYSYRDNPHEDGFGLTTASGSKKEAYWAYKGIGTSKSLSDVGVTLTGGSGQDHLTGTDKADRISGNGGKDVIVGLDGDDIISGGPGHDVMTGGGGSDTFVIEKDPGWDQITDFRPGEDKLDLSSMDANSTLPGFQDFRFIGSKWLAKPGDLGFYKDVQHNKTYIQGDLNGDGAFDFSILLKGTLDLSLLDFIL